MTAVTSASAFYVGTSVVDALRVSGALAYQRFALAGGTQAVTDTMTGTNGTLLESHTGETGATWTQHPTSAGSAVLANNRVRPSTSAVALYLASGVPTTAEYDVSADLYVASVPSSMFTGLVARADATNATFYTVRYSVASLAWQLQRFSNGTPVGALASYSATLTVGQTYHVILALRDIVKKVFIDGVEVMSTTDNTLATKGSGGVRLNDISADNSNGIHVDNFSVRNL